MLLPSLGCVLHVFLLFLHKKIGISTKFLGMFWINLHQFFRVGVYVSGDDWCDVIFQLSKGHCYKNQLILGANMECWQLLPAFYALAFHEEMKFHNLDECIYSGDDLATSCKNWINFSPVTPRYYEGRACKFCCESATFGWPHMHLAHWHFEIDCRIAVLISVH